MTSFIENMELLKLLISYCIRGHKQIIFHALSLYDIIKLSRLYFASDKTRHIYMPFVRIGFSYLCCLSLIVERKAIRDFDYEKCDS
jgi:hypothetical protein